MMAEGSIDEIFRRLQLLRVVHIQMVNSSDALVTAIAALPGVASVEPQADRLAIQLREGEVAVEDLHSAIVGLGARLRMFQPEALDMETAFMKLTEGKTA
jgi:ABC-2 type transport system ATP-binding protein